MLHPDGAPQKFTLDSITLNDTIYVPTNAVISNYPSSAALFTIPHPLAFREQPVFCGSGESLRLITCYRAPKPPNPNYESYEDTWFCQHEDDRVSIFSHIRIIEVMHREGGRGIYVKVGGYEFGAARRWSILARCGPATHTPTRSAGRAERHARGNMGECGATRDPNARHRARSSESERRGDKEDRALATFE